MEGIKPEMEEKRFSEWIERKERIHDVGRLPAISEREVWWVAVGENVGIEINGKSGRFSRPVLIYKSAIGQISKADFRAVCKGFDNLYHFDFSYAA